jgi:hypothetical protein
LDRERERLRKARKTRESKAEPAAARRPAGRGRRPK